MTMSSVEVQCPDCGKEYQIPPVSIAGAEPPEDGDKITCKSCGSKESIKSEWESGIHE